jgi:aconitate hydratase
LINFGILPLAFESRKELQKIKQGEVLEISNVTKAIDNGKIKVLNKSNKKEVKCVLELSEREKDLLKDGGLLNYVKQRL